MSERKCPDCQEPLIVDGNLGDYKKCGKCFCVFRRMPTFEERAESFAKDTGISIEEAKKFQIDLLCEIMNNIKTEKEKP